MLSQTDKEMKDGTKTIQI